jgi:hypothetical protein
LEDLVQLAASSSQPQVFDISMDEPDIKMKETPATVAATNIQRV